MSQASLRTYNLFFRFRIVRKESYRFLVFLANHRGFCVPRRMGCPPPPHWISSRRRHFISTAWLSYRFIDIRSASDRGRYFSWFPCNALPGLPLAVKGNRIGTNQIRARGAHNKEVKRSCEFSSFRLEMDENEIVQPGINPWISHPGRSSS